MAIKIGDEEKLGELILYISQKSLADPKFGSVKLNKILYLSDFLAFGNWGAPITGVPYQHLRMGPAPKRLVPVRDELRSRGDLAIKEVPLMSGNVQIRTVNLREPKLDAFTGKEIALIDKVIETLAGLDAEEASEYSHRFVGWKMTKENDPIPYGTIFISDEPLSDAEIIRGQELAREFGLSA